MAPAGNKAKRLSSINHTTKTIHHHHHHHHHHHQKKKTGESVAGIFKNISTVAVHYLYIKDAFSEICQQIFERSISEDIFEKIDKNFCHHSVQWSFSPSSKTFVSGE